MSSNNLSYCPQCGNPYILISKLNIYCPSCGLSYSKKQIESLGEDNILANEELEGIIKIFEKMGKNKLDALKKLKS